mgnify:FL=1
MDNSEKKNVITDLQTQNTQLSQKLANLTQNPSDSLDGDFVSIASHELRTPMTAIRSYAWMALHRSDVKLSEKLEKYLVRIVISSERMINMVNDLLNISKLEEDTVELHLEGVDLISLCKDVLDEVYYSKSTDKTIQMTLLEQPIPRALADPERLREVLLNLVGNAVKFSSNNTRVTIGFFSDGQTVETFIKDEGPGISKDDLGRLFKKFSRLDNSFTAMATSGGTGLGLYISKKLIEKMQGRIWASSDGEGKGATFSITLPVAR